MACNNSINSRDFILLSETYWPFVTPSSSDIDQPQRLCEVVYTIGSHHWERIAIQASITKILETQ